jgi:hypothetical protein
MNEFCTHVFEYVILRVDNMLANAENDALKQQIINRFLTLWQHFYRKVKETGNLKLPKILFLDIGWQETASDWAPLKPMKRMYEEMINEYGHAMISSILNVFSTIGEKTFLPQGLSKVVALLKSEVGSEYNLVTSAAELLVGRLFYNHISAIKRNPQLVNDLIWMLNMMVDAGISEAYLFRENVITYKKSG